MKKNIIDKFRLDSKVVILTGSAGRIGQRFAHVLSDAGADVVLVDIEEKSNKKLKSELETKFHTNPSSFKRVIKAIQSLSSTKIHTSNEWKSYYQTHRYSRK